LLVLLAVAQTAWPDEQGLPSDVTAEDILDALLGVQPPVPVKTPTWLAEAELRQGGGYAENILYSPFTEENRAFAVSEAELFVFRPPESTHRLSFYAFGHHRHYFDMDRRDAEYNAFARGEWEYRLAARGSFGLNANYHLFDQFFDASISELDIESDRLKQHDVGTGSFARYALWPRLTARVEGGYTKARLDDSDDDYDRWEGSLSLFGRVRSDLTLGVTYRYELNDYDHREKRTSVGEAIPGDAVDIAGQEWGLHGS